MRNISNSQRLTVNPADDRGFVVVVAELDHHDVDVFVPVLHCRVLYATLVDRPVARDPHAPVQAVALRHLGPVVGDLDEWEVTLVAMPERRVAEALVAIVDRHADVGAVVLLVEILRAGAVRVALAGFAGAAVPVSGAFNLQITY